MFRRLCTHASRQTAKPHEVNITAKIHSMCQTFSSVVIQEYIGFSNAWFFSKKFKIMTSILTYITFNIRALTPKACSVGSSQRKVWFYGFIHKFPRFLRICCHIAEVWFRGKQFHSLFIDIRNKSFNTSSFCS